MSVIIYFGMMGAVLLMGFGVLAVTLWQWSEERKKQDDRGEA